MFSKKFDRRVHVALAVILLAGAVNVGFGTYVLWPSNREAGYTPEQPLVFDHQLHAGDLKVDCLYCHSEADKGAVATVPPLSTCMKCHQEISRTLDDGSARPDLDLLFEHWEKQEPVRWNKVNDVADFVYFNHSRHLDAELVCQDCHGPVEEMKHMRREFGLKMSFCMDCHKERSGEDFTPFHEVQGTRGPINCTACHR